MFNSEYINRIYVKLIKGTHHDELSVGPLTIPNPHKILGFSALAHFIYRYLIHLKTGSMQFSGTSYDLFYIFGHLILSYSSFLFPVSKTRNFTNQIIWKELQLHNIVFTSRSGIIFIYNIYYPEQHIWSRFVIVMVSHYIADLITKYYKAGDTMRNMSHDNKYLPKWTEHYFNRFYATSQFGATAVLIIPTGCTTEYSLMSMFSIQLSTFLMTLRLKGIINNDSWHIIYAISLLMNLHVGSTCTAHFWSYIYIVQMIFYIWRIQMNYNKYLGWLVITMIYYYLNPL
jgi:hypothetical protein